MAREEELQQAVDNISEAHKYEEGIDYATTKIAPTEVVKCAYKKLDLSSLWHEASEEPKCRKAILCLNKKGSINLLTNNNKLIYTLAQMDAGVDK